MSDKIDLEAAAAKLEQRIDEMQCAAGVDACHDAEWELALATERHLPALLASWRERGRLCAEASRVVESFAEWGNDADDIASLHGLAARLREAAGNPNA